MAQRNVKRLCVDDTAFVERIRYGLQWGSALRPVVQRGLQGGSNLRHSNAGGQVTANDDERAVTAAGLESGEFHGQCG